jgi:hypothetical protein
MTGANSTTVRVPPAIRRRPGRNAAVTPVRRGSEDTVPVPTSADPALAKAPARVFRRRKLLEEGCYASIGEVDAAERLERGCLGAPPRRALPAPDLVEAILRGRHSDGVAPPRLLEPSRPGGTISARCPRPAPRSSRRRSARAAAAAPPSHSAPACGRSVMARRPIGSA